MRIHIYDIDGDLIENITFKTYSERMKISSQLRPFLKSGQLEQVAYHTKGLTEYKILIEDSEVVCGGLML
jgi:hypothetical protein